MISVDTFHSMVARQAVCEGADIVNDVSGGRIDANMFATVSSTNVASHPPSKSNFNMLSQPDNAMLSVSNKRALWMCTAYSSYMNEVFF